MYLEVEEVSSGYVEVQEAHPYLVMLLPISRCKHITQQTHVPTSD